MRDPSSKLVMVNTALDEKAAPRGPCGEKLVEQFG